MRATRKTKTTAQRLIRVIQEPERRKKNSLASGIKKTDLLFSRSWRYDLSLDGGTLVEVLEPAT